LEGAVSVIARAGSPGNATGTLSLQVQTSPDGSTGWTNIGPVLAAFTTTGGTVSENLNPTACLAFVRCVAAVSGTSPSFPLTVFSTSAHRNIGNDEFNFEHVGNSSF
jgi:hypothetical protein